MYGKVLGGTARDISPAMQNSFLASRNGEIIPEWVAPKAFPQDGAELYRVVDGKEKLLATFSKSKGKFVLE
ncbi:hypothetical protein [Neisseria sp. Ec49-e6-T10]|uniref:hypothetical protein n=1 Tax=Neisseria sp. Ec49-e6-T10 TaxID=3140744 RepID=UPI003EB8AD01